MIGRGCKKNINQRVRQQKALGANRKTRGGLLKATALAIESEGLKAGK